MSNSIQARIFQDHLYKSPGLKDKWWYDFGIFSEQTPLLKENLTPFLKEYAPKSEVFENFDEYVKNSRYKNIAPQVVGLEGRDHWIAIEKDGSTYSIIDSSGCPKEAYLDVPDLPSQKHIRAPEAGKIRQSPFANSCGLYAAFYCAGDYLYNSPYYFWDAFAHHYASYFPITLENWEKAYKREESDYWLHLNDITLFSNFKTMLNKY